MCMLLDSLAARQVRRYIWHGLFVDGRREGRRLLIYLKSKYVVDGLTFDAVYYVFASAIFF